MAFNKLVPIGFLFSPNCDMTVAPTRVPATGKALQGLSTPSAGLRKRDVKAEDVRHCFTSLHGWEQGNASSSRSSASPSPGTAEGTEKVTSMEQGTLVDQVLLVL